MESSYKSKKLTAKTKDGLPAATNTTCLKKSDGTTNLTVTVKGAGSDAGVPYCVWVIDMGSDCKDKLTLTWA